MKSQNCRCLTFWLTIPIQLTIPIDAMNCLYTFTNKYYKTKTVHERSWQQSRVRRTKVTDTIIKITQDKTKHANKIGNSNYIWKSSKWIGRHEWLKDSVVFLTFIIYFQPCVTNFEWWSARGNHSLVTGLSVWSVHRNGRTRSGLQNINKLSLSLVGKRSPWGFLSSDLQAAVLPIDFWLLQKRNLL